jgi:hypothetical protein
MGLKDDSIHGYSCIPQITPKSGWPAECSYGIITDFTWNRILIASIRNLGLCPCPRCLIPLNRVHNLGMSRDMSQRKTLARVDDIHRRSKITAARRVIYEKNYQVDSAGVENLLQEESWVPNAVCSYEYIFVMSTHHTHCRTLSRTDCLRWASIFSRCYSQI